PGNVDQPIEFVTENQSVANWTRLIAVEIRRDGTSLSEYERRETNTLRATCQGAQIYPRDPVTVSGLPASRFFTRVTQCAGSTQPESALYLVIQGKDALQEAFRMDPIHPLLARTYDARRELWRAGFRPSVVKQMQEAAAAIRAKNPPGAPEPTK